jgi:flagellar basal body-associated protein FliL
MESFWSFFKGSSSKRKLQIGLLVSSGFVVSVASLVIIIQIARIQWWSIRDEIEKEKKEASQAHSQVEHAAVEPFTYVYEIKDMSLSIGSRNHLRTAYGQFNLILDCNSEKSRHWLELHRAAIRDAFFEVGLSYPLEELEVPHGVDKLKKSILKVLQDRFGEMAPRDVILRDWVIR